MSDTASPTPRPPQRIRATWAGEHRFETGRAGAPTAVLDGNAIAGQSPVDALLSALAACSGIDLVDILAKRRTPAERVAVEVTAKRRQEHPKRIERLDIEYAVDGAGIEREHAERAIQLAFERYCSVSASLAPDIEVYSRLVLNGEPLPPVRQAIWDPKKPG